MRFLKENAPILIITALTVISFVGIIVVASKNEADATSSETVDPSVFREGSYHVLGPSEASGSAILVEFSDFECPACGIFHSKVKELSQKYAEKLTIVYKHFTLPQHKYANKAAEAAEAAGAQGKFWEMHDILFSRQDALTIEDLKKYAAEVGLNTEQFNSDIDSGKYASVVKTDYDLAIRLKLDSTPSFYLNGKKLKLTSPTDLDAQIYKVLNGN